MLTNIIGIISQYVYGFILLINLFIGIIQIIKTKGKSIGKFLFSEFTFASNFVFWVIINSGLFDSGEINLYLRWFAIFLTSIDTLIVVIAFKKPFEQEERDKEDFYERNY